MRLSVQRQNFQGIATIAVSSFIPTTATASPQNVLAFGLAGWGLETATNLTANFGIAYRLWEAECRTAPLGAQRHMDYQSTMLLIVECGALITTCTIIMFGLFASGNQSGIVGVGIATQIAVSCFPPLGWVSFRTGLMRCCRLYHHCLLSCAWALLGLNLVRVVE